MPADKLKVCVVREFELCVESIVASFNFSAMLRAFALTQEFFSSNAFSISLRKNMASSIVI